MEEKRQLEVHVNVFFLPQPSMQCGARSDHRFPRSLGSWRIKGTDKSLPRADSSVPLMRHDPSDLGSLIQIRIIPKERTH